MNFNKFLKYVPAIAISLILLSAGFILYYILRYGVDVPYMDQWEYIGFFDHLKKGMLTFEELFRQHNEYRQFFPNLIYVSLGWFTDWNVRYEMIVIFILACLVSFNIYRLANFTAIGESWQKWLMLLLANLFIFSPMQYENWLFGVQIEYFLPIACVSSCMVIAFTRINAYWKMIFCMTLATISTFSSINGLLCWFVLFPVFYFSGTKNEFFRKWPSISAWTIGTILAIALYFNGYHKPEAHPSLILALVHPLDALKYFLATLGNTLRIIHTVQVIIVVGGLMILLYFTIVFYIVRHIKDKELIRLSIVWIMLGLYSILTAAMLMIGRLGFGIFQSLASRYTTFTLFLAVALIFLSAIIIHHYQQKRPISVLQKSCIALVIAFLIFTKVNTYPVAARELKGFHATIQHAKAGLMFINFIPHSECVNKIYPSNFDELKRKVNILNKLGYLRPPLETTNVLQDIEAKESGKIDYGSFDRLTKINDSVYTASGHATIPNTNNPADAVLLSFDNDKGKSYLFTLVNADSVHWEKVFTTVSMHINPIIIKAWAFDANTGKAYSLRGSYIINKPKP